MRFTTKATVALGLTFGLTLTGCTKSSTDVEAPDTEIVKEAVVEPGSNEVNTAQAEPSQTAERGDKDRERDYRTFHADGTIDYGNVEDSYKADLVMYLAGNQFMVMEELIKDFQSKNKDIKTIYVETIPPGEILNGQLLEQGVIAGKKTAQNPDLFASVNVEHLKALKGKSLMDKYMIYTRNKLELMVAAGNPKSIKGVKDLKRRDLVQSHPNPLTEGIFKFYGQEMLKDVNVYDFVTAGKECEGCWAVDGRTWFTERHHRETPQRIESGKADVGIVWSTEVAHAKAEGRKVEGVAIPPKLNMGNKVAYAIGILKSGRNQKNAKRYLDYLRGGKAQNIYASYGFGKVNKKELKLKSL